jgi:signal transduction histidine kinase
VRALLRSLWDEPRPPGVPGRVWRDWVLVGVLVPVAVLEGIFRPDLPMRVVSVVLAVAFILTLLWRRTRPLLVVCAAFVPCGVVTVATGGRVPQIDTLLSLLLLPYALWRWGSGREAVTGSAVIVVAAGSAIWAQYAGPADIIGGSAVIAAALALGAAFRYRARARLRELEQAKLLERERLARDLHDTVAHHVSAIAIRAQAGLATSASNPDAAADALRVIEAEASRTLTEMRAMVRVLRRGDAAGGDAAGGDGPVEPADLAPAARITDLEQLAGRGRAGPAVDVEIVGDVGDVPEPVGAAIFRLAQESVTNALRHARHATRIEVRVAADDTSVRLRVSDDGDGGGTRAAASTGYGLIGMSERANLLGGTCEAGPAPERGWTVTAVLPRAGAAT